MTKMIFVNLPVSDLAAATRFYEAIGCAKNPQFSDEKSASMVWSETITIQLLTQKYFSTFTPKHVANAHNTSEVLLALSRDSREDVDAAAQAAVASGGRADIRERQEWVGVQRSGRSGWSCARADLDGHECSDSHGRRATSKSNMKRNCSERSTSGALLVAQFYTPRAFGSRLVSGC